MNIEFTIHDVPDKWVGTWIQACNYNMSDAETVKLLIQDLAVKEAEIKALTAQADEAKKQRDAARTALHTLAELIAQLSAEEPKEA
jgi:hypothetical protein